MAHRDGGAATTERGYSGGAAPIAVEPPVRPSPLRGEPEVVIVGAGAAGIAAARLLRDVGRSCVVLEASRRAGGRAWTDTACLGSPFDLGASWLHDAGHNPLTELARRLGFRLQDHDALRKDVTFVGGRPATPEEEAEYEVAYGRFWRAIAEARTGPDRPVAEVVPVGGPWDATVAHWEGPTIAAAELEEMSLHDFADNALSGPNLLPEEGVGRLLERLADGLPIRTGAVVRRLGWGERAGVVVEGDFGALRAAAAIVTVPTSVLARGAIRFDPPLPPETQQAIEDLPLGLLTKVVLRASGADRLDLPPFAGCDRQVAPGEPMLTVVAWPFGHDHLIGFIGGRAAWDLARQGKRAQIAFAMDELVARFGARARGALRSEDALVTGWEAHPFALGAYSHARPGRAAARAHLATPLRDGRLCFAGEACHATLSGTVGGAWISGEQAARRVLAALGAPAA